LVQSNEFTKEEEEIILNQHKIKGNKWVEIAKAMNGRSDNRIKNFFYAKVRKEIRRINTDFKNARKSNQLLFN